MDELWSTVRGGSQWSGEFCSITRDGQLMWEAVNVSPLTDEDNKLTHYVVIKEDITVRRSYEEQLLRQAHYDPLTELANRVLLMDRLTVALEKDRKSTRLNSSHVAISYAVFCLKKKTAMRHQYDMRSRSRTMQYGLTTQRD